MQRFSFFIKWVRIWSVDIFPKFILTHISNFFFCLFHINKYLLQLQIYNFFCPKPIFFLENYIHIGSFRYKGNSSSSVRDSVIRRV